MPTTIPTGERQDLLNTLRKLDPDEYMNAVEQEWGIEEIKAMIEFLEITKEVENDLTPDNIKKEFDEEMNNLVDEAKKDLLDE